MRASFVMERNFLILLSGIFINGIGGGVYAVSGMMLVFQLSGSVIYSGFAFFALTLASAMAFLIAPFANYVTYKKGLIGCEALKFLLLFTIPLFYFTVGLNVFYVILILFIVALISQFSYPIESTIMPIIVGKENIIKANSYFQTVREGMSIVFVAGAGILVVVIGPVQAILITAICHVLSSITYLFFTFQQEKATERPVIGQLVTTYTNDLKAGIRYIQDSLIPKMIVSIVFINFAMGVMMPNMPAFALIKGNGSEALYGFYLAAISLGIMIGAILAPRVKKFSFGLLTIVSFSITGLLWMGAAALPAVPSLIFFCIGTISIGILNILMFSSIQQQVESAFIGRVLTVLTSAASIGMPFGSLLGGYIGETFTAIVPMYLCGIAMIIFSLSWLFNAVLRKLPKIDEAKLFPARPVTETNFEKSL
ncbi:MFS transporter [Alkalicoccobacillus plakortidis]|uniref:MFS transporter n=1 Tax=Alkalicoccobacillus plakortidis TaxID=444060 RepID=A0ABT0XNJ3_9BACI|nr:MFS transporter [Alkalicoccobacillus plakortidis]MCM2677477.1 MFS transporter [Alkalicoccobacillus plakortidis]